MEAIALANPGPALPNPTLARALRVQAGWTLRRVAAHLDVTETTVARWERGERSPRGAYGDAYAQLLDEFVREAFAR